MSGTMRWKPLPDTLSPECTRFVTRLRELKDRAGVSLAVLAEQTAYSKSSWDRCLNGSTLPPRQAVEGLCRLAGQPAEPILALWELADLTWRGRPGADEAPAGAAPATGAPQRQAAPRRSSPQRIMDTTAGAVRWRPPRRTEGARRRYPVWAVAVTAALVAAVTLPLAWCLGGTVGARSAAPRPPAAIATAQALCAGRDCQGEDPAAAWCVSGSETVVRKRTPEGTWFEVRYRKSCGAAWGRMWFSRPGDRLVVTLPGQRRSVADTDPAKTGGYHTTPMLTTDTPRRVTACYHPRHGAHVCVGG
ncbi:DUF2690 domain-containing protein [Streptomyces sp. NPDC021212]|uniref:helix-turn-helix domain-containing protein n=1 Tax=Streptomyces sp. NPDC021212 TaxID=3365118 RepID=UPI0037B036A3